MKRFGSESSRRSIGRLAVTVSAAALMLGVSQAATVGFNFQCNYCSAASYSGAVVTAPAFGVGTNSWESLSPMNTGYGCVPGYYTLTNTIDGTTAGGGLVPLPNGSVTVTWSAYTANVSGFGGYSRPGPHFNFSGPNAAPGNEQIYWGFLRDGVNFGPGSGPPQFLLYGDNAQPGYQIDLVGLKSLFTNSPFAVQLIAASDSMQFLTNVYIIDATANSTQSVSYPSTPPVADIGDTEWPRGAGGGLSVPSGALDTDHLQIIGARAAHGPGYNFASTIAGFILTDEPIVTMQPNSILASPADTAVLSACALGVPPLTYQWRRAGVSIPGATSSAYALTNVSLAAADSYDLIVSNLYGAATTSVALVTVDRLALTLDTNYVADSNPSAITHDGSVLGAIWQDSSTDNAGVTRQGVMKFKAGNTGQILVSGDTNFDSATGTIMFWMRSSGNSNPFFNEATLFDRRAAGGLAIALNVFGQILVRGVGGAFDDLVSNADVADNNWHHIAVTYDQAETSGRVALYIDGVRDTLQANNHAWSWPVGQRIELGFSHDPYWQPYDGLMDEVRVYNEVLSAAQIGSASTGALVDPPALLLRLAFDAPPALGLTLIWQCPDAILQSADAVTGPYTDLPYAISPYSTAIKQGRKFYRYRGHLPQVILSNPYLM